VVGDFRLTLFGQFSAQVSGQPLGDLGTDKVRGLLAYVALTPGQEHSRSKLAGLLWPEVSEKQARQSLRGAIYRLHALGDVQSRL